jgi:hypothetical protein
MRSLSCHSLRLDRDLVANILHIAVQEVSHLLNGRAERETISESGQIDRRPGPFAPSAHGPPHRCLNGNVRLYAAVDLVTDRPQFEDVLEVAKEKPTFLA